MHHRTSIGIFVLMAGLTLSIAAVQAFDETKYPNWKGQWLRLGGEEASSWDPSGQPAPLTAEYQASFEASKRNVAEGGLEPDPTARCVPAAFPRVMMATRPMEILITPNITYFILEEFSMFRQVYTDGRKFPDSIEATFTGYSIGQWQDTTGDSRVDTLLIETRAIKGPHTYDASGIPFHSDGEAVVTEKLYSDKADPNILHDEITTNDHALTRPWRVTRSYRRDARNAQPQWPDFVCTQDTTHVQVGDQYYGLSPDGLLMPALRGQKPPDLKYFK
jgi:hypothetical protein